MRNSTAGQCAFVKNAGNAAILSCPASQCNHAAGGNRNLTPEISDTKSFGVVFTPTFIDGFSATVDYFDIDVKNYISTIGAPTILSGCYSPAATAAADRLLLPACPSFGDPAPSSAPAMCRTLDLNLPFLRTSGVDFEANYNADLDDWGMKGFGSLSFNFLGTWLKDLETSPSPVSTPASTIAQACSARPVGPVAALETQTACHLDDAVGCRLLGRLAPYRQHVLRREHAVADGCKNPLNSPGPSFSGCTARW